MAKVWELKQQPAKSDLEAYGDTHPILASLLWQRGVGAGEVPHFMAPSYEAQYDSFLFADMRKAVDRVWQAIEAGEQIVIYGDYDADAVTANAVLQQTFRYIGVEVGSYVPDRFTEGYGLNIAAFEKIKADGGQVVITVDCGTNSVEVADWCADNNIELIITDHHEITGEVPKSFALINPKNPADTYPDRQITGVGVAYKFARALLNQKSRVIKRKNIEEGDYQEHWDKWLLDLVAIGTVADCHSLLGENRILVKYGLLVLAKTKWPGLRALLSTANGNGSFAFDTHLLGFTLAPRINAAGRLEHANIALDTLLARDPVVASQAAQVLEKINQKRQDITARLISEAREQALLQQQYKILVLASPDWPKGVVGIAAGRLAGEFGKPVIVLEQGPEEATGSARTYGNFNVVEALKAVSSFLTRFGGHKEAAGLTIKSQDLVGFRDALIAYAEKTFAENPPQDPPLVLDASISGEQLNLDFFDVLSELEPFGAGNSKPLFWLQGAILETARSVGSDGKHLQLTLGVNGQSVQGISFSMGYLASVIAVGSRVEAAVELMADSWNGVRKLKLRVVDLRAV